ncbi:hypothetical protein ACFXB3_26415 [Streptomyces sp. NPDC059447]|uniref:hypothetical protein n=1 Tax=Streptomyces sp. NPDC059447 TaxID=3346834 RepID=UPI00367AC5F2
MSQNFQPPAPDSMTAAPTAPAARTGNVGLGIAAAVVAALVAAVAYGYIMKAADKEYGYAAIAVGALIGFAAGKLGGRNPILPVISVLLSIGAVFLGQLTFIALVVADLGHVGVGEVLSKTGVGGLIDVWKEGADVMTYAFLGIGGFVAFGAAKKGTE